MNGPVDLFWGGWDVQGNYFALLSECGYGLADGFAYGKCQHEGRFSYGFTSEYYAGLGGSFQERHFEDWRHLRP